MGAKRAFTSSLAMPSSNSGCAVKLRSELLLLLLLLLLRPRVSDCRAGGQHSSKRGM
jgi:hypothetical protein